MEPNSDMSQFRKNLKDKLEVLPQRPGQEHPDYRLVTRLRILETVASSGPLSKNRIRIQGRISSNILDGPLNELLEGGLIKEKKLMKDRRILTISEEGREIVDLWGRVKHLLQVGHNGRGSH